MLVFFCSLIKYMSYYGIQRHYSEMFICLPLCCCYSFMVLLVALPFVYSPQTINCSNPPLNPVQTLVVSPVEDQIALVSREGVTVLNLPAAFSYSSSGSTEKEKLLCK